MFNVGDILTLTDREHREFEVVQVSLPHESNGFHDASIAIRELRPEGALVHLGFYPERLFTLYKPVRVKRQPRPLPDWF